MNCRIGRDKECGIAGCAFKRAGATSCADFKEQPIIPKLTAKKEKKRMLKEIQTLEIEDSIQEKGISMESEKKSIVSLRVITKEEFEKSRSNKYDYAL